MFLSIQPHQFFSDNKKKGNDYIIGDIHGHLPLLKETLSKLNFDYKKDRLFALGDLINRGPDSFNSLKLIYEDWFFSIIGNHEKGFVDHYLYDIPSRFSTKWTDEHPHSEIKKLAQDIERYMPVSMTLDYSDKRFGMVHAEPLDDWLVVQQESEKHIKHLTSSRERYFSRNETPINNADRVYVGHTINDEPLLVGNVKYMDSGVYRNHVFFIEKLN